MRCKRRIYNSIFQFRERCTPGRPHIGILVYIFNHAFLYTAFADDSTLFLNDLLSVKNLIDKFKVYSIFSVLKANFSKCEFAGLGSLKEVLEAVCGLKCINLTTDTIKFLGVHFSYNSIFKVQRNFLKKEYNKCFVFGTVECSL